MLCTTSISAKIPSPIAGAHPSATLTSTPCPKGTPIIHARSPFVIAGQIPSFTADLLASIRLTIR